MKPITSLTRHLWLAACFGLLAGPFAASAGASDPVEKLRQALMSKADNTETRVKSLVKELNTIPQLRRAYFLNAWSVMATIDAVTKEETPHKLQVDVGNDLIEKIKEAKHRADSNRKSADPAVCQTAQVELLAIAMLIAEMAENEPTDPKKIKFARKLTEVVVELAEDTNVGVKQTALNALGKITPAPAAAFKVLQARIKDTREVGPRQVAAYALIDLIKYTSFLDFDEQMQTISGVVITAEWGLKDADAEESIRGHCLFAIRDAGKALKDAPLTDEQKLSEHFKKALSAFGSVSEVLGKALNDPRSSTNIRLASIEALTQLAHLHAQLEPKQKQENGKADPLGKLDDRVKQAAVVLLRHGADPRERRGAIMFLDLLGESARPALPEITKAMCDPDTLVRYAAARVIRHFTRDEQFAAQVKTIIALGILMLDPDPDVNSAAAESLEALGPGADVAIDSLARAATIGDAENRVLAMKIIGGLDKPTAIRAYPGVITALTDPNPRVTRRAAETLGQFGAIAMKYHDTQDASLTDLLANFRAAALPALAKLLRDTDAETRLLASEAILSIRPPRKGL